MIMPLNIFEALLDLGLTKEQAAGAWDIIIEHLGIARPPDAYTPPKRPRKNRSQNSKPKHKEPMTEDETFWRRYDDYKSRVLDVTSEPVESDSKPKDAIKITEMINAEITRLKTEKPKSEPEPEQPTPEKKIVRKNRDGQW